MGQKELREVSAALASEYPDADKVQTAQAFQRVLETVLPLLAKRASSATGKDRADVTEIWQSIRDDSEGLFERALEKVDRLQVIFVASKFMNNKSIGEMITRQAMEIPRPPKESPR